jgi:dihydrodipicolinate synthase/N-acetylneuraminate lyase
VKLTCGNVGKLTRICATVSDKSFAAAHPRKDNAFPFLVLGGFVDFLVPSAYANAHGAITGLANLAPVRFPPFSNFIHSFRHWYSPSHSFYF